MSAISLTGLTKRYGGQVAVDQLTLTVPTGLVFGFLGPNGAGKTTTIRMMLGLVKPSGGDVRLLDSAVWESRRSVLHRVGSMVEEPTFWSYLSGRKNLEYLARASRSDAPQRLARIDETLRRVDLHEAAGKKVKAYSHGMRQRLGIAAALLGAPDLLILDEPTNGLDPQGIREMRVLLQRLAREGTTVFISSHLLGEVEQMCDQVAVLAHGALVAEGEPSALRGEVTAVRVTVDDPAAALRVLEILGGAGAQMRDADLLVTLEPPMTSAVVNAALVRAGIAVHALIPERSSLEDAFLALVEDAETPR